MPSEDVKLLLNFSFWSDSGKEANFQAIQQSLQLHSNRIRIEKVSRQGRNQFTRGSSELFTFTVSLLDPALTELQHNWALIDARSFLLEQGFLSEDCVAKTVIREMYFSSFKPIPGPAPSAEGTFLSVDTQPLLQSKLTTKSRIETPLTSTTITTTLTFQVTGMTCSSCVSSIEKHLSQLDGVKEVHVNLLSEKCVVTLQDSSMLTAEKIAAEIEDIGFGAEFLSQTILGSPASVRRKEIGPSASPSSMHDGEHIVLAIDGMTCASCVSSIESGLKPLKGIKSVNVSLLANRGDIVVDPNVIRLSDITTAIDDLGFECNLISRR